MSALDWRVRDEDFPDVLPGGEVEHVIAPQKFVVLHRVIVHDMVLVQLRIGAVEGVPFELESQDGSQRTYKPMGLDDVALKKRLVATGAAVATPDSIAIVPGLEIRVLLQNLGATPVKPRVALLVQEEATR